MLEKALVTRSERKINAMLQSLDIAESYSNCVKPNIGRCKLFCGDFFGQAQYKVKDIYESYLSALSLVKQNRIYLFDHSSVSFWPFVEKL